MVVESWFSMLNINKSPTKQIPGGVYSKNAGGWVTWWAFPTHLVDSGKSESPSAPRDFWEKLGLNTPGRNRPYIEYHWAVGLKVVVDPL